MWFELNYFFVIFQILSITVKNKRFNQNYFCGFVVFAFLFELDRCSSISLNSSKSSVCKTYRFGNFKF